MALAGVRGHVTAVVNGSPNFGIPHPGRSLASPINSNNTAGPFSPNSFYGQGSMDNAKGLSNRLNNLKSEFNDVAEFDLEAALNATEKEDQLLTEMEEQHKKEKEAFEAKKKGLEEKGNLSEVDKKKLDEEKEFLENRGKKLEAERKDFEEKLAIDFANTEKDKDGKVQRDEEGRIKFLRDEKGRIKFLTVEELKEQYKTDEAKEKLRNSFRTYNKNYLQKSQLDLYFNRTVAPVDEEQPLNSTTNPDMPPPEPPGETELERELGQLDNNSQKIRNMLLVKGQLNASGSNSLLDESMFSI